MSTLFYNYVDNYSLFWYIKCIIILQKKGIWKSNMENQILGDYHTHTFYSDAVFSPTELVIKQAIKRGLKEIAITDHSYSNFSKSLSPKKTIRQQNKIEMLQNKYPQIHILKGIEANILDEKGGFDLTKEQCKSFDVINLGFHRYLKYRSKDTLKFMLANGFGSNWFPKKINTPQRIENNTYSYEEIIKNYPISTFVHMNNGTKVNPVKIAKVCEQYGTYVELNRMFFHNIDPYLDEIVANTNCEFIINSDSHIFFTVGSFDKIYKEIEKGRIPKHRIVNYNRLPEFRSTK